MKHNCEVFFYVVLTGEVIRDTFFDPLLARDEFGRCVWWNGERWIPGVSMCGRPIMDALVLKANYRISS